MTAKAAQDDDAAGAHVLLLLLNCSPGHLRSCVAHVTRQRIGTVWFIRHSMAIVRVLAYSRTKVSGTTFHVHELIDGLTQKYTGEEMLHRRIRNMMLL